MRTQKAPHHYIRLHLGKNKALGKGTTLHRTFLPSTLLMTQSLAGLSLSLPSGQPYCSEETPCTRERPRLPSSAARGRGTMAARLSTAKRWPSFPRIISAPAILARKTIYRLRSNDFPKKGNLFAVVPFIVFPHHVLPAPSLFSPPPGSLTVLVTLSFSRSEADRSFISTRLVRKFQLHGGKWALDTGVVGTSLIF